MPSRILIVDDEPSIVISLEYLMRREGFEVEVADAWRPESQPDGSSVIRDGSGAVRARRAAGGG